MLYMLTGIQYTHKPKKVSNVVIMFYTCVCYQINVCICCLVLKKYFIDHLYLWSVQQTTL